MSASRRPSPAAEAAARALLWLALGSWIGAWGFFAFGVSRLAFQVLPGDVAGDMAGVLLRELHLGGGAAGLVVAGCLAYLGYRGSIVLVPVALGLVPLASELIISPEVAALRPSVLGADNTASTQARFRMLHGLSLGLFMLVHLGSVLLLGGLAWLETRSRHPEIPRT